MQSCRGLRWKSGGEMSHQTETVCSAAPLQLSNVASVRASVAVVILMHSAAESQLTRPLCGCWNRGLTAMNGNMLRPAREIHPRSLWCVWKWQTTSLGPRQGLILVRYQGYRVQPMSCVILPLVDVWEFWISSQAKAGVDKLFDQWGHKGF